MESRKFPKQTALHFRAIPYEKLVGGVWCTYKNAAGWSENCFEITAGWSDGPFFTLR